MLTRSPAKGGSISRVAYLGWVAERAACVPARLPRARASLSSILALRCARAVSGVTSRLVEVLLFFAASRDIYGSEADRTGTHDTVSRTCELFIAIPGARRVKARRHFSRVSPPIAAIVYVYDSLRTGGYETYAAPRAFRPDEFLRRSVTRRGSCAYEVISAVFKLRLR